MDESLKWRPTKTTINGQTGHEPDARSDLNGIKDFIQNQILLPRLKKNGVLVVYDPEQRYRDLCLEMATESLRVIDAGKSSITSREEALKTLSKLGQSGTDLKGMLI